MNRFEGSDAVSNARGAILVVAWLFLIAGIITMIAGFSTGYSVMWEVVIIGLSLIFFGALHFIMNAILKGIEQIAKASEIYMDELAKAKSEAKEDKTIRLPMQGEVKRPTHI
jgi:low affinity Fe/Cu permease